MTDDPILAHCEMLHDVAAGLNGVLVVSVFYANPNGESDRPGAVTHHPIGDAERMADTIRSHLDVPGANVYVGLQVMRSGLARGRRGTESDIVAVLGLVADMDGDTGKHGRPPYPASYSVETSPGNEQPVWLFDRPLSVAEAKPLAASLRRATNSDFGTADVAHVWRVPGTSNWPNAKKIARGRSTDPADVTVKQAWDGSLVSVDAFRDALAPHAAPVAAERAAASVGDIPASVAVSDEIAVMLAGDGQPDRSAHAARLIEKIAFAGHSLEECISLVQSATGDWARRYPDDAAARRDCERLWAKFGGDHQRLIRDGGRLAAELMAGLMERRKAEQTAHDAVYVPATPPPEASANRLRAIPWEWKDPTQLPRRQFLYGRHLVRKYMSLTVAPGGLGKSSLTVTEALAMCVGRPLLGEEVPSRLRVWLFNAEDPMDELDRRIAAACIAHKVRRSHLAGRLFVNSGRETPMVIATEDRNGTRIVKPIRDAVVAAIQANAIDVMTIDPFVSTHEVPENDNGAVDKVAKEWGRIADECNIAIELVHHVRKVDGREVAVEDGRGAGALLAAARSARVLNRMTGEQAQKAGVPDQERFGYFSVQIGKANLAPMSARLQWCRLDSVALGNSTAINEAQDTAPAVVSWAWPQAQDVLAGITPDQWAAIKVRVRNQEAWYSSQIRSGWAGLHFAAVLGVDPATERKRIEGMIEAAVREGVFVRSMRSDGKKERPVLEVVE